MRYLFILALCLPLQGCLFFFYVPGSLIDAITGGNACGPESMTVGGRFKHYDGRIGTVEKIYGLSDRCRNAHIPILADVKYDEGK